MDAVKMQAVIKASGVPEREAAEIIDPEFVFWSQCGDCGRDEHLEYLDTASVAEIAAWVASVWRDRTADADAH